MRNLKIAVCSMTMLLCLVGCGRRSETIEIAGTVTYQGQPLRKGIVNFFPTDGKGRSASGIIADGKFTTRVAAGPKKVQIEGFKVVGRERAQPANPNSPVVNIEKQILPERYNVKSELTANITSDSHVLDFPLEK